MDTRNEYTICAYTKLQHLYTLTCASTHIELPDVICDMSDYPLSNIAGKLQEIPEARQGTGHISEAAASLTAKNKITTLYKTTVPLH